MDSPKLPVIRVSWNQAVAFCEWASELTGHLVSLPTEAQWEWACRAGTESPFAFGRDEAILNEHAWWGGVFGAGNTKTEPFAHRVGGKTENAFRLFDMHGNAAEWCEDEITPRLRSGIDPLGSGGDPDQRAIRGGSWLSSAGYCRSAFRMGLARETRSFFLGFRPVSNQPPRSL